MAARIGEDNAVCQPGTDNRRPDSSHGSLLGLQVWNVRPAQEVSSSAYSKEATTINSVAS